MNIEVIITAIIGVCTTAASSLITWLFSKRKYNAEVDNNVISNLQQSVETYKIIVNDLNERLDFYIKLAEDNKNEMFKVKNVLYSVINKSCTDASCTKRNFPSFSITPPTITIPIYFTHFLIYFYYIQIIRNNYISIKYTFCFFSI